MLMCCEMCSSKDARSRKSSRAAIDGKGFRFVVVICMMRAVERLESSSRVEFVGEIFRQDISVLASNCRLGRMSRRLVLLNAEVEDTLKNGTLNFMGNGNLFLFAILGQETLLFNTVGFICKRFSFVDLERLGFSAPVHDTNLSRLVIHRR